MALFGDEKTEKAVEEGIREGSKGEADEFWYERASDFISFKDDTDQVLKFLEDTPLKGEVSFRGKITPKWSWRVEKNGVEKTLDVTAKGLLYGLTKFRPLTGRVLRIVRTGEGLDTQYSVTEA